MTLEKPTKIKHWLSLYRLYREAFPASERKPISMILQTRRKGRADIWCAIKDGRFAGLAVTVNSPDTVLLDYLAVHKRCRNQGIGAEILRQLQKQYPGKGLFIEIESTYEDCPDHALRLRRKGFYLRNGFVPMQVMVNLFGVQMELLGIGCRLSFEEYYTFYRDNYSAWAAGHITEAVHPET